MAGSNNGFFSRRAGFLGLSLLAIVLVLSVGALLWQAVTLTSLAAVAHAVEQFKPVATGIRLLLIGLLALAWPRIAVFIVHTHNADKRTKSHWLALRWRVIGWLLIIELVLGQNLLGRCLAAIRGPVA